MSIADKITSITSHLTADYEGLENIGADLTGIDKNIENIRPVLDTIYSSLPKVTDEGTEVTLTPTKKGKLGLVEKGNSIQDITGYQPVEYIESTGTQYIDTGFKPSNNSAIEFDGIYNIELSIASVLFGSRKRVNNVNSQMIYMGKASGGSYNLYAGYSATTFNYTVANGSFYANRQNYKFDKNVVTVGDTVVNTFTADTFSSEHNLYLFALNNNDEMSLPSKVKLYSCKIYEGTTLARSFIPVYRISDNVIGLYDLINNVFYTNAGTGTFNKGNNVTWNSIVGPNSPVPIKNVTGNNNVVVRNQLFNTTMEQGALATSSGVEVSSNTRIRSSGYINVTAGTTYSIACDNPSLYYARIFYYKSDNTYISNSGGNNIPFPATMPENTAKIRIVFQFKNDANITPVNVTGIILYTTSQTLPLNLGDIELNKIGTYQDYIYKSGDKWYKHEEIKKDTLVEFGNVATYTFWGTTKKYFYKSYLDAIDLLNYNYNFYCSKVSKSNGVATEYSGYFNNRNFIVILNDNDTKETGNSMFVGSDFYYPLGTPTDIEITDTDLISQLEAIDKMQGYNGTTIITSTYEDGNAQMIINASALKGE